MCTEQDVYAHWGYTEINSESFGHLYDNAGNIHVLRDARTNGVAFDHVTAQDRLFLSDVCRYVRRDFNVYTRGIQQFANVAIDKSVLGSLLVPSIVSRSHPMSFSEFIMTPAPDDPSDCRNVTVPSGGYVTPADPLILGLEGDSRILIDGYHRAALFWKHAEETKTIPAYLPA